MKGLLGNGVMGAKLTDGEIKRLREILKMSYAEITERDLGLLIKGCDQGLLEEFFPSQTFGKLFTRYRITPAGRPLLDQPPSEAKA